MEHLKIERIGGFGGFGLPGAHLQSTGEVAVSDLSDTDRRTVEALFESPPSSAPKPDAFQYRITRQTQAGPQTIVVPEDHVPMILRRSVKDELK